MSTDLTYTLPCDGCSVDTYDPIICNHDFALCENCVAESKCKECRVEAAYECGRLR